MNRRGPQDRWSEGRLPGKRKRLGHRWRQCMRTRSFRLVQKLREPMKVFKREAELSEDRQRTHCIYSSHHYHLKFTQLYSLYQVPLFCTGADDLHIATAKTSEQLNVTTLRGACKATFVMNSKPLHTYGCNQVHHPVFLCSQCSHHYGIYNYQ